MTPPNFMVIGLQIGGGGGIRPLALPDSEKPRLFRVMEGRATQDHLFHLSQTFIESFIRSEHVQISLTNVEKALDNVSHAWNFSVQLT